MKVLVVDDDIVARIVVVDTMSKLGHEHEEAADGDAAWDAYHRYRPDVVITDQMMPGIDGLELCRRIRADANSRYTYLILATGLGLEEDVISGFEAGADDYLVKPYRPFELRARLTAAQRITDLHRQLAHTARELDRANAELAATARTDALSGVGNRRRFDEDIVQVHARAQRLGQPYCVAMVDIDRFKDFNDRFGHPRGDEVIRSVGQSLVSSSRRSDAVYRYGGEEFVIIYPESQLPEVLAAAERTRAAIEARHLSPEGDAAQSGVTISLGVAQMSLGKREASHVIAEADEALYEAKGAGRNRVASSELTCTDG